MAGSFRLQELREARSAILAIVLLLVFSPLTHAQHDDHPSAGGAWAWSGDAVIFLNGNLQFREFRDFHQFESQNWFMGAGARTWGGGTLMLHAMVSLEPFTLRRIGSAQVFQTGETFEAAPLIDYQHPHDLFMGLSARFTRTTGPVSLLVAGGLVDAPALGPTPFMHRTSARLQPTAALGHHQLDSTHIAHGVITGGVGRGPLHVEASWFRGREPDEQRKDLDFGALDSWSTRVSWRRPGLYAQISGGRLREPDWVEPGDIAKVTASIEYEGVLQHRLVSATAAFGQNRERFGVENAWLGEATLALTPRGTGYVRGEIVDKHILEAGGLHPPGFEHPHELSRVAAFTVGYQHDAVRRGQWRFSVGGDVTTYRVPLNLFGSYGTPVSVHVYGRLALGREARAAEN